MFGDILGANPGETGADGGGGFFGDTGGDDGGFFGGWGGMVRDTVGYALRSKIDAEFNYPHEIAQRQMELMGEDGEMFGAGDVAGANWLPWAVGAVAVAVVLIVVLKD